MNDRTMPATAYGRPMAKTLHPEMCDDKPEVANTLTALANDLAGQLTEALDRADRIIGRIVGPEPGECAKDCQVPNSLDGVMADNVRHAGILLHRLDRIAGRVGG